MESRETRRMLGPIWPDTGMVGPDGRQGCWPAVGDLPVGLAQVVEAGQAGQAQVPRHEPRPELFRGDPTPGGPQAVIQIGLSSRPAATTHR
jgi:hypothetical protein